MSECRRETIVINIKLEEIRADDLQTKSNTFVNKENSFS